MTAELPLELPKPVSYHSRYVRERCSMWLFCYCFETESSYVAKARLELIV